MSISWNNWFKGANHCETLWRIGVYGQVTRRSFCKTNLWWKHAKTGLFLSSTWILTCLIYPAWSILSLMPTKHKHTLKGCASTMGGNWTHAPFPFGTKLTFSYIEGKSAQKSPNYHYDCEAGLRQHPLAEELAAAFAFQAATALGRSKFEFAIGSRPKP